MNVDEVERFPALAAEREWLAEAVRRELPLLGICLGAQLLARALGAEVRAGEGPEIGFAPVEVSDPEDPVLGGLAPSTDVLHWHGDVFDLPDGAQPLASSARTEHQAFRVGNAWGASSTPRPTSPWSRPGWRCRSMQKKPSGPGSKRPGGFAGQGARSRARPHPPVHSRFPSLRPAPYNEAAISELLGGRSPV